MSSDELIQFPESCESSPNIFSKKMPAMSNRSSETSTINNDLTQYPINDEDDSINELNAEVKQINLGSMSSMSMSKQPFTSVIISSQQNSKVSSNIDSAVANNSNPSTSQAASKNNCKL